MAGIGLPAFPQHGKPIATDLLPIQTAAGTLTDKTTAADLRDFILTSVKTYGAVGDGVTDDTAAIQVAILSGLPIYFPPGIYKTTSTLNVNTYASNGQVLKGSGSYYGSASFGFSAVPPPGTAVIRPTAAVTKVFVVDGTPVGGVGISWVQGFGIEPCD